MGLMQFFLTLYFGWNQAFMSPSSFMANPLMWLKLMSAHGTQYTCAPDFAYNLVCLCLTRVHNLHNFLVPLMLSLSCSALKDFSRGFLVVATLG